MNDNARQSSDRQTDSQTDRQTTRAAGCKAEVWLTDWLTGWLHLHGTALDAYEEVFWFTLSQEVFAVAQFTWLYLQLWGFRFVRELLLPMPSDGGMNLSISFAFVELIIKHYARYSYFVFITWWFPCRLPILLEPFKFFTAFKSFEFSQSVVIIRKFNLNLTLVGMSFFIIRKYLYWLYWLLPYTIG